MNYHIRKYSIRLVQWKVVHEIQYGLPYLVSHLEWLLLRLEVIKLANKSQNPVERQLHDCSIGCRILPAKTP